MQIQGVIERKGKKYVTYTFNNPNAFYEVSYKSMRANQNIDFIRCNYMRHNGNIRLLFHIENYCTLATAVTGMSPNAFASLLINILDAVLEIKSSGFINIETVDLEPKNIYIDMEELKPYFIYVPVNVQSTPEHYYAVVEYLKKSIVYMIQTNINLQSNLTSSISREIVNQCNSIESLKSSISNLLGIYQGNGSNPYREQLIYFNHQDILKVVHTGYSDDDEEMMRDTINEWMDKTDVKRGNPYELNLSNQLRKNKEERK